MRTITSSIVIACGCLVLGACGRDEPNEAPAVAPDTAQTGAPVEQPGTDSPSDVSAVNAQTWVDDVTIGSKLNRDGSVDAGNTGDDFAPGQPVNLAMEVGDAPVSTPVKVIWYGPGETKIGEESKSITAGEKYLSFTAADTAKWTKGDYRAEIWVGDEKVNQQQFQIVDADKANM